MPVGREFGAANCLSTADCLGLGAIYVWGAHGPLKGRPERASVAGRILMGGLPPCWGFVSPNPGRWACASFYPVHSWGHEGLEEKDVTVTRWPAPALSWGQAVYQPSPHGSGPRGLS